MAGTIPLSLTQQLDRFGNPLAGGKLYLIQAGTVSTPQNGYQDSALTLLWPNPIVLDASGRLPQFFLADGNIKVRLTDVNGAEQLVADGLVVTGASSGGGGGSPVDATTILATGDIKARYGTGILTGFVRLNGRTIGSATSGATERANADCDPLFEYLWGADANLVVSTGRGVSANADWVANKTITLPDWRGRALAALDDMGNSAAGRLTSTYFGTAATALGAAGGVESSALTAQGQLPSGVSLTSSTGLVQVFARTNAITSSPGATQVLDNLVTSGGGGTVNATYPTSAVTVPLGGSGTAFKTASPMMLATFYIKL